MTGGYLKVRIRREEALRAGPRVRGGVLRGAGRAGQTAERVDSEVTALGLIALMDGLQVQWLSNRNAVDPVAALRSYVESPLTVPLH